MNSRTDEVKTLVIGAGAAGLIAAGTVGRGSVTVYERNEKAGKKLYITGKGRCNVTNDCDPRTFLDNVVNGQKFLLSALYGFTPQDTIKLIESEGVKLKTERGRRVFPVSDKSSDIIKALKKYAEKNGAVIEYGKRVLSVNKTGERFSVKTDDGKETLFDNIIVATGGKSCPLTGSSGDGYKIAESFSHTVVPLAPALVPIELGGYDGTLRGVSLKNVRLTVSGKITEKESVSYSEFGEMLFTDTGISGPCVLSISSRINRLDVTKLTASVDLKPALDSDTLEKRIISDFSSQLNKQLSNALGGLLLSALIPFVLKAAGLSGSEKVNGITRQERKNLVAAVKNLSFPVKSLASLDVAVVTSGGVSLKELNPKTMESRLTKGLYFAGEVIDADALTGGYNIQIALSTGYAAGKSITEKEQKRQETSYNE